MIRPRPYQKRIRRLRQLPWPLLVEQLEERALLSGDTLATATLVELDPQDLTAVFRETIDTVRDIDLFAINLAAGDRLTVDVDALSLDPPSGLDSFLHIFHVNGGVLAYNDDSTSRDSLLTFEATSTETYYIGVSSYDNSFYDPRLADSGRDGLSSGPYELKLSLPKDRIIVVAGDPGATLATATPVAAVPDARTRVFSAIDVPSDVDMYAVDLSAGDFVTARVGGQVYLDSVLRVFDSAGTQIAVNDDGGSIGVVDARVDVQVTAAGRYFIGVSSFNNLAYDPRAQSNSGGHTTDSYALEIEVRSCDDSVYSTACPVSLTPASATRVSGVIDTPSDQSFFPIDLLPGDQIVATVDTLPHGETLDSTLQLYRSDGSFIAYNDDANGRRDSQLEFQAPEAGRYFLVVANYGNERDFFGNGAATGETTGAFDLHIALTPFADLHATGLTITTEVAGWGDDVTINYVLHNQGRADAGPFDVQVRLSTDSVFDDSSLVAATVPVAGLAAGATLTGSVTGSIPGPPAGFTDSDFIFLSLLLDSGNSVDEGNETNNSGRGFGLDLATLVVTRGQEAESNDLAERANPVALNADIVGRIEQGADVDYFRIVLRQDGRLSAVLTADFDARLSLLAAHDGVLADGTLLIQSDGELLAAREPRIVQHLPGPVTPNPPFGTTYLLKVEGRAGARGTYTLTTEFAPANLPLATAPTGIDPRAIVSADFNGDQILDFVVANSGVNDPDDPTLPNDAIDHNGSVSVLLGLGDGTFRPEVRYPVPGIGPAVLITGNFDDDQLLDLAVSCLGNNRSTGGKSGNLAILLGNGDGSFQSGIPQPIVEAPVALATGDFDHDQILDLVGPTINHGISFFHGKGDGTFEQSSRAGGGANPQAVIAGDFDRDGHLDMATANVGNQQEVSSVSVIRGLGDGHFGPAFQLTVEGLPVALVAEDFTGDGILDIGTTTRIFDAVALLVGNGDGTFFIEDYFEVGSKPVALISSDFNGDGRPDLAAANDNSQDVTLLLADGMGEFELRRQFAVGQRVTSLAAGDFNGDGRVDISAAVLGQAAGGLRILLGRGDGTLQSAVDNASGGGPKGIVSDDFNGDGRPDLAVANEVTSDVSVLLGHGDGTLADQVRFHVTGLPEAIASGDFNEDGRKDLAVVTVNADDFGGRPSFVEILLGLGDGTFRSVHQLPVGIEAISIVTGQFNDFDDEGFPTDDDSLDLAVATSESGSVSVLLGLGNGDFLPAVDFELGEGLSPADIVTGQFNDDPFLDIAAAIANPFSSPEKDALSVLLGNGDGTFRNADRSTLQGLNPKALTAGDFNADGIQDLATNAVDVFRGHGDGTFEFMADPFTGAAIRLQVGQDPKDVVVADFNQDGVLDLATANADPGDNSILLGKTDAFGQADGTFAQAFSANVGGAAFWLTANDFNGDGLVDLASMNASPDTVAILLTQFVENRQPEDFPLFFANAEAPSDVEATPVLADINGDGHRDSVVIDRSGAILARLGTANPQDFAPPITINIVAGESGPDFRAARSVTAVRAGQGYILAAADQAGTKVRVLTLEGELERFIFHLSLYSVDSASQSVFLGSIPPPIPDLGNLATEGALLSLPTRVLSADLTGDGDAFDDLVMLKGPTGNVAVFLHHPFSTDPGGFFLQGSYTLDASLADLALADVSGDGLADILATNQISGDVDVLINTDHGQAFEKARFRAGAAMHSFATNTGAVRSLDRTRGLAAADFNRDGNIDIVTLNPGSNQFSLLFGQGAGSFANPVSLPLDDTSAAVAAGQFNDDSGDGKVDSGDFADLAFLNEAERTLAIYLSDGAGGFTRKQNMVNGRDVPILAGDVPTGLVSIDVDGDGLADLQVGSDFGDVLTLFGQGDGIFQPRRRADQTTTFAVAPGDATDGENFIVANRAEDHVRGIGIDFAQDLSNGIRAPGQVLLEDFNRDGHQDLLVVNSGANNVVVYLGSGPEQFDTNNPRTFFTGTDPISATIADLGDEDDALDLVVANQGSNDISILLGEGEGADWTFTSGPRLESGGAGPVATAVNYTEGNPNPRILVSNSQSSTVTQLQGVGEAFFDDAEPLSLPVGPNPGELAIGNFGGGEGNDLATVNSGSITVINNFVTNPVITTNFTFGGSFGLFGDFSGDGLTDIALANSSGGGGDLVSLLLGGDSGLTLFESLPFEDPSSLALAAVAGEEISLWVSREGQDGIDRLTFNGKPVIENPAEVPVDSGAERPVSANLTALENDSLRIVAVIVTGQGEVLLADLSGAEAGAVADDVLAAFGGAEAAVAQLVLLLTGASGGDESLPDWLFGARGLGELPELYDQGSPLNLFILGLDEATGQVREMFRLPLPALPGQTSAQRLAAWNALVLEAMLMSNIAGSVAPLTLTARLAGLYPLIEQKLNQGLARPEQPAPEVVPMDEGDQETAAPEPLAGDNRVPAALAALLFGAAAWNTWTPHLRRKSTVSTFTPSAFADSVPME